MTTPNRWPHSHVIPKDPDATLDYTMDWADWLADGETIASSAWTLEGVTSVSESATATTATVFVSGGTEGATAILTNRITTNNAIPREDERTLLLKIKER